MTTEDVAGEIRTTLRRLTAAVLVCLALSVGVGVFAVLDSRSKASDLADQTERTNAALCTFRADIQNRIDQTETFLLKHPEGFAGVSVATLRRSLDGQRSTVVALQALDCSPRPTAR